jgi:WhiB family redox-sensing transcriptional regulator
MTNTINFYWQDRAACKGMSSENYDAFFPDKGGSAEKNTGGICNTCPVKQQCLDHAIKHEEFGYWGGTNASQRQKIRIQLGIELIDIDYEDSIEYDFSQESIDDAVQASIMKRGPKGPRKKEEQCELDSLSQF